MSWKTCIRTVILALALLAVAGCGQIGLGATPQPTQQQEMEAFDQAHLATGKFMGAVLVARGDEVLFQGGYGKANLELDVPDTPETEFRLGSLSPTPGAVIGRSRVALSCCNSANRAMSSDWRVFSSESSASVAAIKRLISFRSLIIGIVYCFIRHIGTYDQLQLDNSGDSRCITTDFGNYRKLSEIRM